MSLKSLWEKFIQNRPVYQKLAAEYERAMTDLTDVRHKHEGTTAKLDEVQHTLNKAKKERDQTTVALGKSRHRVEQLKKEHDQTKMALTEEREKHGEKTAAFNALHKKHNQTKIDLTKARADFTELKKKYGELDQKYKLVSKRMNAKSSKLDEVQHILNKAEKERDQTKANLRDERAKYNALQKEHDQTKIDLTEARAERDQTKMDLTEEREEHAKKTADLDATHQNFNTLSDKYENLDQKYKLVSKLMNAKSRKNEAFEKFKKLFDGPFMAFANEEFSLAEEAAAVKKLQHLKKRLKEIVAFPHTYTKKSIGIGGRFSSGKSEFVNSFITKPDVKMPVDITPATAIPSFVISNSKVSIKGFSRYRATVDIEPALYRQLSHGFVKTFSFNLKDLMPSITVEVPLRKGLFENICLIDTPGYDSAGGNTDGDRETAAEFLKNRDALIWMIDLDNGTIPRDDLVFIKDDLKLNGLPFYVVLNKADKPPESDLKDILEEVKERLQDEGIEPVGISAYSASLRKEYLFDADGVSLYDFFRSQNRPKEGLAIELRGEIESVFAMYENAIRKDERTAEKLNSLDLDLNNFTNQIDPDKQEVLSEKMGNIKKSQEKDFTSIKAKMEKIKKDMLEAVDEIFSSLRPPSAPTPPPSNQGSAVKRQGSIKGGKYIRADAEQPSAPKLELSQPRKNKPPFVNPNLPPLHD